MNLSTQETSFPTEAFSVEQFIRYALGVHPELEALTNEALASPATHDVPQGTAKNIGKEFFPDLDSSRLVEFNRSANSLLNLEWVLKKDYESFTKCQPAETRLSQKSFEQLCAYTKTFLSTPEDIQAMKVFLAINDLGKIQSVADTVNHSLQLDEVDHDEILRLALEHFPEQSPGFESLTPKHQKMILDGLATQFNLGQFMQAENVPANLTKLKSVDEQTLHFYLLHTLFDIAGAAGHITQEGSLVMNEPTFQNFSTAIESVDGLTKGKSEIEVYNDYLHHVSPLEVDLSNPGDYMLARISGMMRITDPWQAVALQATINQLPSRTRGILEQALGKTGIDDGTALLSYYSPAFLKNLGNAANPKTFIKTISTGLMSLANTIQLARRHIINRRENGVCTLFIHDMATAAKDGSQGLDNRRIQIRKKGNDLEAIVEPSADVDIFKFEKQNLAEIPGKKLGVIGIGGGSDAVQAGIVGKLLTSQDPEKDTIVISVRSKYTRSQDANGKMNLVRTVEDYEEEIAPGIYVVTPKSTGSGRFVENVPAVDMKSILVISDGGDELQAQLQMIVDRYDLDTVIAVDTGGDALLPQADLSSQDAWSLTAINKLSNVTKLSCEVATGIDAPQNAESVLLAAKARYHEADHLATELILRTYREWEFNGSRKDRYGKTALAWQQALRGHIGMTEILLPEHVISDDNNPWTPYVDLRRATRGIFFMELAKHIEAIR